MIPIPDSVTITRHTGRESELYDKGREWLAKDPRTPGIHASGLLDPMQAYWSAVDPRPLSNKLVTMFMVGKVLHAFILGSYQGDVDLSRTDDGSSHTDLGYDYSPDLYLDGMVREVKTSRSFYEPKELRDVSMYVEQILTYMAATETLESELWVLFLNLKDDRGRSAPAFRCYTVKLSADDLARTKDVLSDRAKQLSVALELRDPSGLELCREWKCGASNCNWYDMCQPEGRYGTPKYDSAGVRSSREKKTKSPAL